VLPKLEHFFRRNERLKKKRVMFLHIFKTGGTSIHDAASVGLRDDQICPIRSESPNITESEIDSTFETYAA
jgi:hypothetical protein